MPRSLKTQVSGLSEQLKDLQNHRDAGLISDDEYRRKAASVVQDGQSDLERAALASNSGIQSLTGAVGVMVETHCKETWQQALFKRWTEVKNKRAILAAAFVVLVIVISTTSFLDEDESIEAMIDRGAGMHEVAGDESAANAGSLEAGMEEAWNMGTLESAVKNVEDDAINEDEGQEDEEIEDEKPLQKFDTEPGEPEMLNDLTAEEAEEQETPEDLGVHERVAAVHAGLP